MTELISSVAKRADELHPMAAKVARASARQKPLCECTAEEARTMRETLGNPFAPLAAKWRVSKTIGCQVVAAS